MNEVAKVESDLPPALEELMAEIKKERSSFLLRAENDSQGLEFLTVLIENCKKYLSDTTADEKYTAFVFEKYEGSYAWGNFENITEILEAMKDEGVKISNEIRGEVRSIIKKIRSHEISIRDNWLDEIRKKEEAGDPPLGEARNSFFKNFKPEMDSVLRRVKDVLSRPRKKAFVPINNL